MSVLWMFVILLGCWLSHATQSQNTCTCSEELRTVCEPSREEVRVPCPNMTASIMTFTLFKDKEEISSLKCSHEKNGLNCTPTHIVFIPQNTHESISFILTNSSKGIYRCEGAVIFPPPYKPVPSEVSILTLVEGRQCQKNKGSSGSENPCNEFVWIWIMVVVLLFIYSTAVTIMAFVIWFKLKNTDSQSDYMNTKPRPSRDRKKKKGVQNPIPRHF